MTNWVKIQTKKYIFPHWSSVLYTGILTTCYLINILFFHIDKKKPTSLSAKSETFDLEDGELDLEEEPKPTQERRRSSRLSGKRIIEEPDQQKQKEQLMEKKKSDRKARFAASADEL